MSFTPLNTTQNTMSGERAGVAGQAALASSGQIAPQADPAASKKNEFLQMMVAQINNQDPLNPMDGTEYVSQLAQFSQVESLEKMSQSVGNQNVQLDNLQVLQTAALVDKQVQVETDNLTLSQERDVTGRVTLPQRADEVSLRVYDSSGRLVSQQALGPQPAGDVPFTLSADQLKLADGHYTVKVQAHQGDQVTDLPTTFQAKVEGVRINGGSNMMLNLSGLGMVPLFKIQEITA